MFELNVKNLLIAGGIAIAATAAVVTVVAWMSSAKWNEKAADKAFESMVDAHNQAVEEHPGDINKARFAFELAASEIRKTFIEVNTDFDPELKEWLDRFDEEVKRLKKEIRKA